MENIMISNISYKLSTFADYSNISYTSENMMKVMRAFEGLELLPGIAQEISADGNTSRRIQLTSANGALTITVYSNRMDAEITSLEKTGFSENEKEKLLPELCELIICMYDEFKQIMPIPNRLAWFTSYVNFELDGEKKKKFREKFIKPTHFYESNLTDEFMVRYAGRENVKINESEEKMNFITTISRWLTDQGTNMEVDGYRIDFDINTWQENRKNRFYNEDIKAFVEKSIAFQKCLEEDFIYEFK